MSSRTVISKLSHSTKKVNNAIGRELLNGLNNAKKPINKHKYEFENEIIQKAFGIYNDIEEEHNHHTINKMLHLCLKMNRPEKVTLLWNDIDKMIENGLIAYPSLIKWCVKTNNFEKGKQIHENITMNHAYIALKNVLIDFYGHYGDIEHSLNIFDSINDNKKQIVTINSIIKCLINNNQITKALSIYDTFNYKTDNISHVLAIKGCKKINNFERGQSIIDSKIKFKTGNNIKVLTTLIDFYGHFGFISDALNIFNSINNNAKNSVTVNAMLKCLINNKQYDQCILLYKQYDQICQDKTDDISHGLIINACKHNKIYFTTANEIIKTKINVKGISQLSIKLINTLIDFYGHCNEVESALNIFNSINESKKDIISVSAMMNVYINNGLYQKALSLFENYKSIIKPDNILHSLCIKAYKYTSNF
eukprot:437582_1